MAKKKTEDPAEGISQAEDLRLRPAATDRRLQLAQEYEMVGVEQIQFHPANPRTGDVALIGESIERNGFYGAVVVQRSSGYVLAGNHRLIAARKKGLAEIPAIFLDVDDEQAMRILLADNRTSDVAGYDEPRLAELLAELSNSCGLEGTGWTEADLEEMIKGLHVGPEAEVQPKTQNQKLAFKLDSGQLAAISHALEVMKGEYDDEIDDSQALTLICQRYTGGDDGQAD